MTPNTTSPAPLTPAEVEDLFSLAEWFPLLPDYGVRMLRPADVIRYGDFRLSGAQVLFAGRGTVGNPGQMRWHGDKYITPFFRYTRQIFTDEPSLSADAGEEEVIEAYRAQVGELARAEREAFGAAVSAYAEANEGDAAPEHLAELRAKCDRLMSEMKFERRGLWWDAEHGTWGIGAPPWRDDEEEIPGAIYSGPHS